MKDLKGKKILMVIAHQNFRDEEYEIPHQILENKGIEITVASSSLDEAAGKLGMKVKPDLLLEDVEIEEYDGVVFIGGPGASEYFSNPVALDLAKKAYEERKVVAAICIAPSILAKAGILAGKKATAFPSETQNLKAKGAIYTGQASQKDGNIITANGPQAAGEFSQKIIEALS